MKLDIYPSKAAIHLYVLQVLRLDEIDLMLQDVQRKPHLRGHRSFYVLKHFFSTLL